MSQGVGWWQASDGLWYPPKESDEAPEPGWWLAADGRWYPPVESVDPPEAGWWLAADGRWYPPESPPADHGDAADRHDPGRGEVAPASASGATHEPRHAGTESSPPAEQHAAAAERDTSDAETDAGHDGDDGARGPRRPMSVADRPPRTVEAASTRASSARRRPADASQQIRRRDDASREDAIAQASARFMAASRALKFLEADIEDNREHPGMDAARSTARAAHAEASGTPPPSSGGVRRPRCGHRPDGIDSAVGPTATTVAEAVGSTVAATPAHAADEPDDATGAVVAGPTGDASLDDAPSPPPAAPPQPPRPGRHEGRNLADLLIEMRTSPLGADIDHIGDRLLVFIDRVELRDRNDRIRQVLPGEDITDVVVQRKFTGAVLAVESGSGESIVTRGLKPEQADQARLLIHKRTRAGRPVTPKSTDKPREHQRPNPSVNGPKPPDVSAPSADAVAAAAARLAILNRDRLNEADLLRKLADLHRAGVLTDIEFEEKIALVGRLVSGETLVIS